MKVVRVAEGAIRISGFADTTKGVGWPPAAPGDGLKHRLRFIAIPEKIETDLLAMFRLRLPSRVPGTARGDRQSGGR